MLHFKCSYTPNVRSHTPGGMSTEETRRPSLGPAVNVGRTPLHRCVSVGPHQCPIREWQNNLTACINDLQLWTNRADVSASRSLKHVLQLTGT